MAPEMLSKHVLCISVSLGGPVSVEICIDT